MKRILLGVLVALVGAVAWSYCGIAHGADVGQIPKDVSPAVRQWFRSVENPDGANCCDIADGHLTDYEVRPDGFWVPIDGKMWQVPPRAVVKDSKNPFVVGIVWYRKDSRFSEDERVYVEGYFIRCFVPGGGA